MTRSVVLRSRYDPARRSTYPAQWQRDSYSLRPCRKPSTAREFARGDRRHRRARPPGHPSARRFVDTVREGFGPSARARHGGGLRPRAECVGARPPDRSDHLHLHPPTATGHRLAAHRYAELIDDGDFAGIGTLLGGAMITMEDGTVIATGAREVEKLSTATTKRHIGSPRTQHGFTNVIVEHHPDTPSAWIVRARFTVRQATDHLSLGIVAAGRYCDMVIRGTDGRLPIAEHRMLPRLLGRSARPPAHRSLLSARNPACASRALSTAGSSDGGSSAGAFPLFTSV